MEYLNLKNYPLSIIKLSIIPLPLQPRSHLAIGLTIFFTINSGK